MAGGGSSLTNPLSARRRNNESSNTTIHALGEDLLLAIFLYLPSLASLVRAALTCRSWRQAVASSPDFRRHFRALHSPPLLGLFFEVPPALRIPNTPAFPSFVPARCRGRDIAAAVRRGDFFLTAIDDRPNQIPCWSIVDSRCGRVLLRNWDDTSLVLFNPLMPRSEVTFDLVSDKDLLEGSRGQFHKLNYPRVVFSAEDPVAFRVVLLAHDESRVRASVFSSRTREWSVFPWLDVSASLDNDDYDDDECWLKDDYGMQANGFVYWAYEDRMYLISLDMSTMKLSVDKLPECVQGCNIQVGETKDGTTCMVYSDGLNVGILMHTKDDDGVDRWVPDRVVPMDRELERVLRDGLESEEDDSEPLHQLVDAPTILLIFAVQEGYAYLVALVGGDVGRSRWFMSLCLETMKLEKLWLRAFDSFFHPYIMAWPSSLLGNYGQFAVEDAP